MGFLNLFSRPASQLMALPSGSFTVDRDGRILVSTLPQSFPTATAEDIGAQALAAFRSAQVAQVPLSEIIIRYPSLKITARELRGGALIFLVPQTLSNKAP
jgi:hypothetical protein